MSKEPQPQTQPALSVEYKVSFRHNRKDKQSDSKLSVKPQPSPARLPRITRLLALAHHLQGLIDQGIVSDYADIARLTNLSRARLTQIMNLNLLAPKIQEDILSAGYSKSLKEHGIRLVLKTVVWEEQAVIWEKVKAYPAIS